MQGLWSAWSQLAGFSTVVMTGFALTMGANASFFALMTSIKSLTGFAQFLVPLLGRRIQNQKRFIVVAYVLTYMLRTCLVAIPFLLVPSMQLGALMVILAASLFCIQAAQPFLGSWQASIIPANIRARFTSRQVIVSTLVSMVVGFSVGRYIDSFAEVDKQQSFVYLLAASTVIGLATSWVLGRAPAIPIAPPSANDGGLQLLLQPFRDAKFRRALLFFGAWQFALGIAAPFYSVFMIERLEISYTTISLFHILAMAASIASYRLWAAPIDRYGSQAVLRVLLIPHAVVQLLWIFNRPESYALVAVALGLGGFLSAGISLCITPLVYGLLPEDDRKPMYMGCWSAAANLIFAVSTLSSGLLMRLLEDMEVEIWGIPMGNLQVAFLLSAVLQVGPIFLLRFVQESRSVSLRELLGALNLAKVRELVRRRREGKKS